MQSVSTAKPTIKDQPEPVFAEILERRGYDPSSSHFGGGGSGADDSRSTAPHRSPSGKDYFNSRLSPIQQQQQYQHSSSPTSAAVAAAANSSINNNNTSFQTSLSSPGGGGSYISAKRDLSIAAATGSSDFKKFSPTSSPKKKKIYQSCSNRRPTSASSSSRSPSPARRAIIGAGASSSFLQHKQKIREIASGNHHQNHNSTSNFSPSSRQQKKTTFNPSSPTSSGSPNVSVSDSKLFRAPSGGGVATGGINASIDYNFFSGGGGPSSPQQGARRPSSAGGGRNRSSSPTSGRRNTTTATASSPYNSNNNQNTRPSFGTTSNYQKWSHMSPSQVSSTGNGLLGGELFALAMRGAQSQMDDAETMEVRREIQGAIDSFLYRPVARRFSEETAKWVEDHILPFAQTQTSNDNAFGSGGSGGINTRPGSAATQKSDDSRDSGRLAGVGFAGGGGGNNNNNNPNNSSSIAARRQKALAMTEEVLPLMFHHVASEIRNAVRLRIEAALLKKETRTSYL